VPWTIYSRRPVTSAAAQQLITAPQLSDAALAGLAGCSSSMIASTRQRLESIGVIPHVPAASRTQRPRPQRPSAARDAIAVLGPDATPRQVADAAGVSLQAAHKALARARPAQHDCAAAADAISVSRMPRMLDELAAAADSIAVMAEITCDCGQIFCVTTADAAARQRRFCSARCRNADSAARGRELRQRVADPDHPFPRIPSLPRPPDWSEGTCAHVPPAQQGWWTSQDRVLREAAANLCLSCPVLQPCAEFSLSLPVHDPAIYGGMSQIERLRRKHAARQQAMPKPSPRNLR
jgi:Transcription factor WhiB